MIYPRENSSDSSLDSPVPIRRVIPRYEIISEMPSYNSESTYSPESSNYTPSSGDGSFISSLGNDSPIRRNIPRAISVNDIEAFSNNVEAYPVADDQSIWTHISSYYSLDEEDSKPFFSKFIILLIWLSFLIGVCAMEKPNLLKISPANESLFLQFFSLYPDCHDTRGEIWRFFTSTIVHGDIGHIFINTLLLYPFMYLIEASHGCKKVIFLIFMVCIYSSLVFGYFNPYVKAIGCSGLVFGFNGALTADLIINYYNMDSNIKFIVLLSVVFTTLIEIFSYNFMYRENIAYESHWSGWITGLLFGLLIFKDKITKTFNIRALFIAGNLLSYYTAFFIYQFISNWPPISHDIFSSSEHPYCCELKFQDKIDSNNETCFA